MGFWDTIGAILRPQRPTTGQTGGSGTTAPSMPAPAIIRPPAALYSLRDKPSVIRVQSRLTELGLLDPPSDGLWGASSLWALGTLLHGNPRSTSTQDDDEIQGGNVLPKVYVDALADSKPLPVKPANDFVGRVAKAYLDKGIFIARHKAMRNHTMVEGHDPNGRRNDNRPNVFNDVSMVWYVDENGVPRAQCAFDATTEPSRYWTLYPMNEGGAAHIDPGFQKAWTPGEYHGPAMRQARDLHITRDPHKTFKRDPRYPDVGGFGIHHHQGYNLSHDDMGRSSAGCQVVRNTEQHNTRLNYWKQDARYQNNRSYIFASTVLLQDWVPQSI